MRMDVKAWLLAVGMLGVCSIVFAMGHTEDDRVFAPMPDDETAITRVAFGSCFDLSRRGEGIWDSVRASEPDLFLLVGDSVYADTDDPEEYAGAFEALESVEGYVALREETPLIAVWDDHDYGLNDSGADFKDAPNATDADARRQSQRLFLDAFGVPEDSPRRAPRAGIYDSYTFGPDGQRLQIIVLDTRYNRSDLVRDQAADRDDWVEGHPGGYLPNEDPTSTILGEEQWSWLEARLREPADARLIVSSIQFVANGHRFEKWGNFPHERERMIELIETTGAQGVFFLSGDRHRGELSREDEAPYPIYDLTSSGMNRSGGTYWNEINEGRVGTLYHDNNFGVVEFEWGEQPVITFELRDVSGRVRFRHRVGLESLRSES